MLAPEARHPPNSMRAISRNIAQLPTQCIGVKLVAAAGHKIPGDVAITRSERSAIFPVSAGPYYG
jgi:hypothetical protein